MSAIPLSQKRSSLDTFRTTKSQTNFLGVISIAFWSSMTILVFAVRAIAITMLIVPPRTFSLDHLLLSFALTEIGSTRRRSVKVKKVKAYKIANVLGSDWVGLVRVEVVQCCTFS